MDRWFVDLSAKARTTNDHLSFRLQADKPQTDFMKLLDLTLDSVAENLALDEALVEDAELSGKPNEVLRLWESPQTAVIIGRSSRVGDEVHTDACQRRRIPIY